MDGQTSSILVVEDDEDICLLMRQIVERLGSHVLTAENGGEAMDIIEREHIDVVLLDVMMPVIDGFEVLAWIRERYSMVELPVIMVTALSESDFVLKALKMGANDFVPKPFDFGVVQARVNTQLTLKRLADQNSEFLGITSHDLRKNVALITDVVSVMGDRLKEENLAEDFHEACSLIKTSAEGMKQITEDFLALQVIHDGNIRLFKTGVDIHALIMKLIEQDNGYARRKRVSLTTDLDKKLVEIDVDAMRIEQVLANLIGNAIKFSQPGTTTCVRTRREADEVLIEVCDEGPGFLPEEIDRVFHQYVGLSNRPTGGEISSGMGLKICARFVQLHKGEIGVSNNEGPGATFWLRLPACVAD